MNKRVTAAFAFGGALILAAYTFSDYGSPAQIPTDPSKGIVAAVAPERPYIASTDSNNDGIPDWQEALQNTTPLTISAGANSTYSSPTTLTDQFAVVFFESMVRNKQNGEFAQSPEDLAQKAAAYLMKEATIPVYTLEDIIITSANSRTDIARYNSDMETALNNATPKTPLRNELDIVKDAMDKSSEATLAELDPIIAGYEQILASFLAVRTPSSLAREHLTLVNSVSALLSNIQGMRVSLSDPLLSLMHIQQYQASVTALTQALQAIEAKLKKAGVTYYQSTETWRGMIEVLV